MISSLWEWKYILKFKRIPYFKSKIKGLHNLYNIYELLILLLINLIKLHFNLICNIKAHDFQVNIIKKNCPKNIEHKELSS